MTSLFSYIAYGEFIRLIICAVIDSVEYVIPILLSPFVGDIYDVVGLVSSIYMFGWVGLFSTLDLIPGLDILPINTITWMIWMISKRRKDFKKVFRYGPF